MRNLAKYPITLDEAIDAVQQELDSYTKCLDDTPAANRPLGDIHALALQEAINRLKRLQIRVNRLLGRHPTPSHHQSRNDREN